MLYRVHLTIHIFQGTPYGYYFYIFQQEKSSLIKTDVGAGTQLHKTHRMLDVSVKPNYLRASSSFDSNDNGNPLCGKTLHRYNS
jgi:hypothetical protein